MPNFEGAWGLCHEFLVEEPVACDACMVEWGRLGSPKLVRGWAVGWEWLEGCISVAGLPQP
jgi:hypothetical protein